MMLNNEPLQEVPLEILVEILSNLEPKDLIKLCQTNKYFRDNVCQTDFGGLWRRLYQRNIDPNVPPSPRERYFQIMKDLADISRKDILDPVTRETAEIEDKIRYLFRNKYRDPYLRMSPIPNGLRNLQEKFFQRYRDDSHFLPNFLEGFAESGNKQKVDEILDMMTERNIIPSLSHVIFDAGVGGHLDIVKDLLERGASISSAAAGAALGGHLSLVKTLIAQGASNYYTIAYNAAENNRRAIVEYLFSTFPADRLLIDELLSGAAIGGDLNLVEYIIEKGQAENVLTNYELNKALAKAATAGNVDIMDLLIRSGANDFNFALEDAIMRNQRNAVRYLLGHGATNVNDVLIEAVRRNNLEIVKDLVNAGATNFDQAIDLAFERGYNEIYNYLMKAEDLYLKSQRLRNPGNQPMILPSPQYSIEDEDLYGS